MPHASVAAPTGRSVGKPRRLHGLDAARAVAIIGMLATNVGPRKDNGDTDLAMLLYDIPYGRASLLFMLLAGIGMSLMTGRSRECGGPLPWRTIVWRAAVLLLSGLALQLLGHEVNVILTYYGVMFLCGLPLLRAPTWLITTLAISSLVFAPILWLVMQQRTSTAFDFFAPSLADPLWTILHATLLTGAYPVVIWLAPFLLGMMLGRLPLAQHRVQWRLIRWGLFATVAAAGLSLLLVTINGPPTTQYGWDHLMSAEAHSQMPLWLISSTGSAVLVTGIFLRGQTWVSHRVSWLVSAGRLSLTIYVAHLVVLAFLVRPGPDLLINGYLISAAMSLGFVVAAHLWWRTLGTGPLERLLVWPPTLQR